MYKIIEEIVKKAIDKGWIVKNPSLTDEALVFMFVESLKDISVRDFLKVFYKE